MRIKLTNENLNVLKNHGLEIFSPVDSIDYSFKFSTPCGTKFSFVDQQVEMDAFSYMVSGFLCGVKIGRYCSFGENIQIGRQGHPTDWITTSPFLYLNNEMIVSMGGLSKSEYLSNNIQRFPSPPTKLKKTIIEHDVWIGHGAMIMPGITIRTGSIIAAGSVVSKNVEPYSIIAGNPGNFIKHRIPFDLIDPMLKTEWWNYSPADLNKLPIWSPALFIEEFNKIKDTLIPYKKNSIQVIDIIK